MGHFDIALKNPVFPILHHAEAMPYNMTASIEVLNFLKNDSFAILILSLLVKLEGLIFYLLPFVSQYCTENISFTPLP